MPIYKPSELREFLNELGIRPKKGLSQNFLIDGNIIRKIVKAADVRPNDLVLEIGPGPGSLTEALLEAGAKVIAVEKDDVLAAKLERLQEKGDLTIHREDILKFPLKEALQGHQKAKVIANLPYHLTSFILIKLVQESDCIESLTLMVQEEVARRITAKHGNGDYGSLTVFLNFYCNPHYLFTVSKNCFYPVPKVESAIIKLDLKKPPLVKDVDKFFEMTRRAFEHRRKMLKSSLRELYAPELVEKGLSELGLNPQARPEELSLDDFLNLFHIIAKT